MRKPIKRTMNWLEDSSPLSTSREAETEVHHENRKVRGQGGEQDGRCQTAWLHGMEKYMYQKWLAVYDSERL